MQPGQPETVMQLLETRVTMPVNSTTCLEFDKKRRCVELDLRDSAKSNRLITVYRTKNPLSGDTEFVVRAAWTKDRYHPTMTMSRSEFKALVAALDELSRPRKRKSKSS